MYRVVIDSEMGEFVVYIMAQSTYHAIELALYKEGMNVFQSDRSKYSAEKVKL
jgi:hypothetical protein